MTSRYNFIYGPCFHKSKKKVGGIVVSFESFLDFLSSSRPQINANIYDLNKNNYTSRIHFFLSYTFSIFKIVLQGRKANVLFFGTENDYKYLLPILVLTKKFVKFDLVTSKFAGNFDYAFEKNNFFYRYLIRFCLKNSTANFFQTKYLVDYFKKYNSNTFHLPTSRVRAFNFVSKKSNGRLVYVGSISKEKGLDLIFKLSKLLQKNDEIDLFGPIKCSKMLRLINSNPNLNYLGMLEPSQVQHELSNYKYLLYPSSWVGEGYSGVVIESMMAGTPVLTSDLRGLSEIVHNGFNGYIFSNENYIDGVLKLLKREDNYEDLVLNCIKYSTNFDRSNVLDIFKHYLATN